MKLLLTGATGFVGRNLLIKALEQKRYEEIIVPVRSREKLKAQFQGDGFDDVPFSVTVLNMASPNWEFSNVAKVDHVVHSAGVLFGRTARDFFDMHVKGTERLFETLNFSKAVVLSSMSAGGPCGAQEEECDENSENRPVTLYGESKLEMERMLKTKFSERNYLCLRPPMVLGPRDTATLPLFKLVRSPLHFKPGWHEKLYSFISVDDLIRAIFLALDDSTNLTKRIFYVGSKKPVSDRDFIRTVAEVSKKFGIIVPIPHRLIGVASRIIDAVPQLRDLIPSLTSDRVKEIWPDRWVISSNAFSSQFGWEPIEELSTTLRKTSDWYVKTGRL